MQPIKRIDPPRSLVHDNGFATSRDLTPRLIPIADCKPLGRDAHKHPPQQIAKLAASLSESGFVLPILVDAETRVVAGWGLVLAARQLGLAEVPAVRLIDLSDAKLRALRLALNRLSQDAKWDREALALEFAEILDLEALDLTITAFEIGEIDVALNGDDDEDPVREVEKPVTPVSRPGDLWNMGEHRLFCGDALAPDSYARLLGADKAQMVFADPPYNVPIDGHASGLGKIKHQNFVMGVGELSSAEFMDFLKTALGLVAEHSVNSAVHFVCMDWRHLHELIAAGGQVYSQQLNLCVWRKTNAGMGSLYRSQHELILVFKVGKGSHINNVALGRHGRNRTNVWDYPGQSALSGTALSKLSLHPTVKPVGLIADAMRDCSHLGGLILDPFGGAGTTLIAAERTGRRARLIELDPTYVDVSVERWQRLTGGTAVHARTGRPFSRTDSVTAANEQAQLR